MLTHLLEYIWDAWYLKFHWAIKRDVIKLCTFSQGPSGLHYKSVLLLYKQVHYTCYMQKKLDAQV